jgi:7-keto-8-aminopelargonate synthetase-like enzyme
MDKRRSFFSRTRTVQTVHRLISELAQNGAIHLRADSGDGDAWSVEGKQLKNFGSCNYMGLEHHPALLRGAEDALRAYGTSFSISRAYVEHPLYRGLEGALGRMTDRPVLVTQTTTYSHLSALPVLVGDRDLVIVDQFAHASVHMATKLLDDVRVETVRHSRLDRLEELIISAGDQYERVWYLCDGVYSMLGDFAPYAGLRELLARQPRLNLYIDDAHGFGWSGTHGRGDALMQLGASDRVVVALSLAKAFGSTGGALAFANAEQRERVRSCGGPMIFSGPHAPAVLGASLASANLHLSADYPAMQEELQQRIERTREALRQHSLETATADATPVFMVQYDTPQQVTSVMRALREDGLYCCVSTFPAVPINKPSIRFSVSRQNALEDIDLFVERLAQATRTVRASPLSAPQPARPHSHEQAAMGVSPDAE